MTNEKRSPAVDGNLYDRFNQEVGKRHGIKPGAVKECLEEAIRNWIKHKPSR